MIAFKFINWNMPNLILLFLYTTVFLKNHHVKRYEQYILVINAIFMAMANFYFGANGFMFLFFLLIILFGVVVQYLNKIKIIKDDDFKDYFGLYNMFPYFFSAKMVLSWADVL